MLEKDCLIASGKEEFDKNVGAYFVNMYKNQRTLHITNNKGCYYSKCAFQYLSFNSLDEVEQYEANHQDATPFRRCGNCFRKRRGKVKCI